MIPYREVRRLVHEEMRRRGWELQGNGGDPAAFRHVAPAGEGAVVVNVGRLWRQVSKRKVSQVIDLVREQIDAAVSAVMDVARVPWSVASGCVWLVLTPPGTGSGAQITATNVVPESVLSAFTVRAVIPRHTPDGRVHHSPWPYRPVTVLERECWAVDDRRIVDAAGSNMGGGELEVEVYREGMFLMRSLPGQPPVSSLIIWPGCLLRQLNVAPDTPALISVLPCGHEVAVLLGNADVPERIEQFRTFCGIGGRNVARGAAALPWRIWWVEGSRVFALPGGNEERGT